MNYDYLVTGEVSKIRESGATSGIGMLATYGYDDLRRRTSVTYGNGAAQAYAYDPVSRLASLANDLSGTTSDLTESFTYNPASQIVSETRSNDAYAFHPSNENTATITNGLNQLSTVGGVAAAYDAKGNLTTDPVTGRNNYFTTSENLLREPVYGVGYDTLDRLLYAGGAEWVADGDDNIAEYVGGGYRRYVLDPDGQPVVWYEGTGTTDRRFLSADERGSIISASDGSAGLIGINSYDEYGRPGASNVGRYGYTGQMWIGEYGLNYHHARFRNPSLSPFMQPDPIGPADDANLYQYALNDPLDNVDPSGLDINAWCGGSWGATVCGQRLSDWFEFVNYRLFEPRSPRDPSCAGIYWRACRDSSPSEGPIVRNPPPQAPPAPTRRSPVCDRVAGQAGGVIVASAAVAAIPGIGALGGIGVFVNWRTGSFGAFTFSGAGYGLEGGWSVGVGLFRNAGVLRGVNVNVSASTPRGSGTVSFLPSGKFAGAVIGPAARLGLSATATNTVFRRCVAF